jgi:NAD(P)H-dependent FMN reductase
MRQKRSSLFLTRSTSFRISILILTKNLFRQQLLAFRKKIEDADGVLICTPEYVYSLPGSLKNAVEWMVSTTLFTDKPAALITAASSGTESA